MLIKKVINNNIVSAMDNDKETIIMGKGIGFKAKPGDDIPQEKIEKIFKITCKDISQQFKELIEQIPSEYIKISTDIISYAKKNLNLKLNQSIYITLTDHIYFAIIRVKEGIFIQNALLWEIKRFYPQEYEIGLYAIDLINKMLNVTLNYDEAGFIALHFVNTQYGTSIKDAVKFPNLVRDIVDITKKELNINLDESTLHYERFITHIKFLLQRLYRNELLPNEEKELSQIMQSKYPKEYKCSTIIANYIKQETDITISGEEIMYLTIHIRRVSQIDN